MPSSVRDLCDAVQLSPVRRCRWGEKPNLDASGIYLVARPQEQLGDPASALQCPLSVERVRALLDRCPRLTVDGVASPGRGTRAASRRKLAARRDRPLRWFGDAVCRDPGAAVLPDEARDKRAARRRLVSKAARRARAAGCSLRAGGCSAGGGESAARCLLHWSVAGLRGGLHDPSHPLPGLAKSSIASGSYWSMPVSVSLSTVITAW